MIALLLPHTGAHAAPHAAVLPALPLIFRRAVAAVRRKQAAPETPRPSGAATPTVLPAAPQHDLLTDADLAALRTRKVLPRADGDIVIDERNGVHVRPVNGRLLGDLPRREPMRREPGKPPWYTTEQPVYGQAPQLAIEAAGQERQAAS